MAMTLVDRVRRLGRAVEAAAVSGDPGPILQTLSDLLGAPVSLRDRRRQSVGEALPEGRRRRVGADGNQTAEEGSPPPVATELTLESQGRLWGTLVVSGGEDWRPGQWVLIEHARMALGLLLAEMAWNRAQAGTQQDAAVQRAVETLTYSELVVMRYVLRELDGSQGLVRVSIVADRAGITRSVLVNALRKMESARVIRTQSAGRKGTLIRVQTERLRPALEALLADADLTVTPL